MSILEEIIEAIGADPRSRDEIARAANLNESSSENLMHRRSMPLLSTAENIARTLGYRIVLVRQK